MPSIGTWRVVAFCDNILVGDFIDDGGQAFIPSGLPGGGDGTLSYVTPTGAYIYLDSSTTPILFIQLPLGFIPDGNYTYTANMNLDHGGSPIGWSTVQIIYTALGINELAPATPDYIILNKIGMTILELFSLEGSSASHVCTMPPDPAGTTITVYGNVPPNPQLLKSAIYIDGTYFIFFNEWTITTANPIHVGNRITITDVHDYSSSPNSSSGSDSYHDLSNVTRIIFSYPAGGGITRTIEVWKNGSVFAAYGGGSDLGGYPTRYINIPAGSTAALPEFTVDYSPYIIEWTTYYIIIWMPWGFGSYSGDVDVSAHVDEPPNDDGTQFSGSVPLGTLNIAVADTSGIYNISRGKKTDTLYDPARNGASNEVAIPKPFAKTGFIGG